VTESPARQRRRLGAKALVWAAIGIAGFFLLELAARQIQGYELFRTPLVRRPVLSQLEQERIYNARALKENPSYFAVFNFAPPTFAATEDHPTYLFKPNLRMVLKASRIVVAQPGETPVWSTNSYGFRGPEFSVTKAPGVLRIVCLGASTTEGSESDSETYPAYLQLDLSKRFPGRQFEVINAGHSGYNSQDMEALLRLRILELHPDVLVVYHAANDVNPDDDPTFLSAEGSGARRWLEKVFWAAYGRSALFATLADQTGLSASVPKPHTVRSVGTEYPLVRFESELTKIDEDARAARMKVILSSFVTLAGPQLRLDPRRYRAQFDDIYRSNYPLGPGELASVYEIFNQATRSIAERDHVTFVDVAGTFPRDVRYFPFDAIHLSPQGNRILAADFVGPVAQALGMN